MMLSAREVSSVLYGFCNTKFGNSLNSVEKKKKAMEKMKTCLCLVTKMSWVPRGWGDDNIFILFLKA